MNRSMANVLSWEVDNIKHWLASFDLRSQLLIGYACSCILITGSISYISVGSWINRGAEKDSVPKSYR
jgi:hypothetical protein